MATKKKTQSKQVKGKTAGQELLRREAPSYMNPFEEMEHMFESFFPRGWLRPLRGEWPSWAEMMPHFEVRTPRINVIDQEDKILVNAEVPGVSKDDLDVSLSEDAVTIRGSSEHREEEKKGEYHRREISRGEFSRTIRLPAKVDDSKAKAKFKNGILELILPKVEKSRRRKIKVES